MLCGSCCRILLCLAVVGEAWAEIDRVEVNVTEGGSVTLNCSMQPGTVLPASQLVWSRGGGGLGVPEHLGMYLAGKAYAAVAAEHKIARHSKSRHVAFAGNDTGMGVTFALVLTELTVTEDSRYDCHTDGRAVAAYAVNVLGPPRDIRLSMNFTVVEEDEKVKLVCKAAGKPAPQYVWLDKSGTELPSLDGTVDFAATLDVAGWVSCKAYNALGYADTNASIVVRFKPKIVVNEHVAFRPGAPLRLICNYTSIPEAVVAWFKDGAVVGSSRNFRVEKFELLPRKDAWQLVATKNRAVSDDAGLYACQANNSLGSSVASTLVTDRPFNTSMNVTAVGDTSIRLLLTTYSVDTVTFYLNITAVNSSLLLDRWVLFVPGQWPPPGVVAAGAEHRVDEVIAHKVQNDYRKLGLRPATRYHIELKVLTAAEVTQSLNNAQLHDVDADSLGVSAFIDFVTHEASAASGEKRGSKMDGPGAAAPGDKQQQAAQPALTHSAASNSAVASPGASLWLLLLLPLRSWFLARWPSLAG